MARYSVGIRCWALDLPDSMSLLWRSTLHRAFTIVGRLDQICHVQLELFLSVSVVSLRCAQAHAYQADSEIPRLTRMRHVQDCAQRGRFVLQAPRCRLTALRVRLEIKRDW